MLHRVRLWLRVLLKSEALESDMDEEMRLHLERATERYVARGLSLRDARTAARRGRTAEGVSSAHGRSS